MNNNIWVVSDTHFNHANILRFTDSRSFTIRHGLIYTKFKESDDLLQATD